MSTGLGRTELKLGSEINSNPNSTSTDSNPNSPQLTRSESSDSQDESGHITTSTLTSTTTLKGNLKQSGNAVGTTQTTEFTHLGAQGLKSTLRRDGSVQLKPIADETSGKRKKKVRALVSFQARESHFDRFNSTSQKDPFRGFYTLFWIGLFLTMLNTFQTSFQTTGSVISLTFATLFSKDARVLAISDGVLIGSTFICVLFGKLLQKGWLRYWPTLIWVQHAWQAAMLGAVVKWTRYREWPWVQSGFFVLHTLSMMMKIHSYMAVNGNMADTYHKMKREEMMLEERVMEIEGVEGSKDRESAEEAWGRAVEKAIKNRGEESGNEGTSTSWNSLEAQRGSSKLRHRNTSKVQKLKTEEGGSEESSNEREKSSEVSKQKSSPSNQQTQVRDPHPLSSHPDTLISNLARDIENAREELISTGSDGDVAKRVMWPENVTYANFWDYLLVPTLVYELEYPRTDSIRPLYVLEKTLATFGTFFVIYVITEHWIMPHQPSPETPLITTFLHLALPMMINYLLIFYIMFECICNGFAELTRFADREFYQDWWNATSMDVFSRKWNKPVHSFLLKHVYASSIAGWGISRKLAMFLTFLLSSLLHELVMAIVSGKVRGYLFLMQMAQLPLIVLGQIPFIKRNETLGNLIFWVGLMMGFPLLNIGYLVY